jgi:hypothetical protein
VQTDAVTVRTKIYWTFRVRRFACLCLGYQVRTTGVDVSGLLDRPAIPVDHGEGWVDSRATTRISVTELRRGRSSTDLDRWRHILPNLCPHRHLRGVWGQLSLLHVLSTGTAIPTRSGVMRVVWQPDERVSVGGLSVAIQSAHSQRDVCHQSATLWESKVSPKPPASLWSQYISRISQRD